MYVYVLTSFWFLINFNLAYLMTIGNKQLDIEYNDFFHNKTAWGKGRIEPKKGTPIQQTPLLEPRPAMLKKINKL